MSVSKNVKDERERQGLTQKELANLASISLSTLQRIENPSPSNSPRLSAVERVDLALWINNCYKYHGSRDDGIGIAINTLKNAFENNSSIEEIQLAAMNFNSYCKHLGVCDIPENMPGFVWTSVFDPPQAERVISGKTEHELILFFRQLNATGQDMAIDHTRYLAQNPEYLKETEEHEQ